jgi:hypothetical protein
MEPVVATGGNWWQMRSLKNRANKPKTVAVGCDRMRKEAHGKEGVPGSSPEEGFAQGVARDRRLFATNSRRTDGAYGD